MTHIMSRIPSPRNGPGQALYRGPAGAGRRWPRGGGWEAGAGRRWLGGWGRAAPAGRPGRAARREASCRREQLLRFWQAKRRGGILHQSRNPRCSVMRKSFSISQRTAPIPRLFACQGLRSCPSKTQRPSHRRPEEPGRPRPARRSLAQGPPWPAPRTQPTALSVSHASASPPRTPQSVSAPETVTDHPPL